MTSDKAPIEKATRRRYRKQLVRAAVLAVDASLNISRARFHYAVIARSRNPEIAARPFELHIGSNLEYNNLVLAFLEDAVAVMRTMRVTGDQTAKTERDQ